MRQFVRRALAILAVASLIPACGGGSGGGGGETSVSGLIFTTKGGKGLVGDGGRGGYFDVLAKGGGDLSVRRSGGINVTVGAPKQTPYLGLNPMVVSSNFTLSLTSAVGTGQLNNADGTILNANGTVTGIWVKPGVTLTIRPNDGPTGNAPHTLVTLDLADGVLIEGTIKIGVRDGAGEGDGLGLDTSSASFVIGGFWIASAGKLDLSGASSVVGGGRSGGNCAVDCDASYIDGDVVTRGGDGATKGGTGGNVNISCNIGYVICTGSVTTDGGVGASGVGGDGGTLDLRSILNGIQIGVGVGVFKGVFSTVGGDGTTGGGKGGYQRYIMDFGSIICSGQFRTFGGKATVDGDGGNGSSINCDAYGPFRALGTMDTHGGNGAGTGDGGSAGDLNLYAYDNDTLGTGTVPDSSGIWFGAHVLAHGGDGKAGGNGGFFTLHQEPSDSTTSLAPQRNPLNLLGYSTIDLSGGDGAQTGGDAANSAGVNNILETALGNDDSTIYYASSVYNEADFIIRGGNGTLAGGAGYGINIETENSLYPPYAYGVENRGNLDGRGGDGGTMGGPAGDFHLYGKTYLKNSGKIFSRGGNGGTGDGGAGSTVTLLSDGPLEVSGLLDAGGGASDSATGGTAGSVSIASGNACTIKAPIQINGGDSTTGAGNNGGILWISSQEDVSKISGALSVKAGSGAVGAPVDGEIWIDGLQVAGP